MPNRREFLTTHAAVGIGLSRGGCGPAGGAGNGEGRGATPAHTARDTLSWWKARPAKEQTLRTSLSPEKEAAILADWHGRSG